MGQAKPLKRKVTLPRRGNDRHRFGGWGARIAEWIESPAHKPQPTERWVASASVAYGFLRMTRIPSTLAEF